MRLIECIGRVAAKLTKSASLYCKPKNEYECDTSEFVGAISVLCGILRGSGVADGVGTGVIYIFCWLLYGSMGMVVRVGPKTLTFVNSYLNWHVDLNFVFAFLI